MKENNCFLNSLKTKLPAFTLAECLIALIVISGSVMVYQSLTKSLSYHMKVSSENNIEDWQLFTHQFYLELETAQLEKVENNSLYLKHNDKQVVFHFTNKGEFKKRNNNGKGHHPMLFQLSNGHIEVENKVVKILFTFRSGLKREFCYDFSEKD